jgi:hypothetical protein
VAGYDALVTIQFEQFRQAHPTLTSGRAMNKFWYGMYGARAMFADRTPVAALIHVEVYIYQLGTGLALSVLLQVDGQPFALPTDLRAFIVLNLQSYAAGNDLWARGRGDLGVC